MAFVQKNWLNQSDDGVIPEGALPISAEELNRIEQGIADSLQKDGGTMMGDLILNGNPSSPLQAAPMQYVDNNILHFHGRTKLIKDSVEHNYFTLPMGDDVDIAKYVAFFCSDCVDYTFGKVMRTLCGTKTIYSEGVAGGIGAEITSDKKLHIYSDVLTASKGAFDFDLILIPMAKSVELTLES